MLRTIVRTATPLFADLFLSFVGCLRPGSACAPHSKLAQNRIPISSPYHKHLFFIEKQ